jgi:nicotinate-nucleotide adenylyltransferase
MIGLLGGSFNPAHAAHKDISLYAMKALGLREVWWLVTPGNPLKSHAELAPLETRMREAQTLTDHPKIKISGIEAKLNTRYTYDSLKKLTALYPQEQFVWIMGSDNWQQFHKWQKWQEIAALLPIVVIDRPGSEIKAAKAGLALMKYRSKTLHEAPCLILLHGIKNPLSSTAIRALKSQEKPV